MSEEGKANWNKGAMAKARKTFEDEEALRLELQRLGSIHDCAEAGCDPKAHKGKIFKRPELSKKYQELQKKYART